MNGTITFKWNPREETKLAVNATYKNLSAGEKEAFLQEALVTVLGMYNQVIGEKSGLQTVAKK